MRDCAYERSHEYTVPASGDEVRELTVHGVTYPAKNTTGPATFAIQAIEHCRNEFSQEIYADGTTGTAVADAAAIVGGARKEVTELGAAAEGGTIVVPPAQHASALVRQLMAAMMKPVQAETITEESMTLEHIDLYYRPWWAFEFVWKPKEKRGVVEIDAITGQMRQGQALVPQLQRLVTRDNLFDLGADTAGLLIPGGSIAVKIAKMAIDKRQKT